MQGRFEISKMPNNLPTLREYVQSGFEFTNSQTRVSVRRTSPHVRLSDLADNLASALQSLEIRKKILIHNNIMAKMCTGKYLLLYTTLM